MGGMGMSMGMGMGMSMGMGMGMSMGMGMNMGKGTNMGMGMNMGMGSSGQIESQDSPTHYLAVVSWPVWAWGEWDLDSKGPIEKCVHRDQVADADGSGDFFTSCCTAEGAGMRRDCGTTRNTDFQTAADQCESQGGQLCTADEVVAVENGRGRRTTVSQGCSVDGPRSASGADLNHLWTSTPCSP